jgi:hypothetical protein
MIERVDEVKGAHFDGFNDVFICGGELATSYKLY